MTNWEVFLQTLPIIGTSLVGIFGTIGAMILIVYLLNKGGNYIEGIKENKSGDN